MAVAHTTVSVSTTPVSLLAGLTDSKHSTSVDRSVVIQNDTVEPIYLGGPGVSNVSYGYKIPISGEASFDLLTSDELFAYAASTVSVKMLILGL